MNTRIKYWVVMVGQLMLEDQDKFERIIDTIGLYEVMVKSWTSSGAVSKAMNEYRRDYQKGKDLKLNELGLLIRVKRVNKSEMKAWEKNVI